MARMYSRKRGKSGSDMPRDKKALWVTYKPKEIETIIVKLAKEGMTSAQIGQTLRDTYGIPLTRGYGIKISKTMKGKGVYPEFPEDLLALIKKAVNLRNHMEENNRDYTSKRGLELTESKIRRLVKYYKGQALIDKTYKYDPQKAKLLVK